MASLGAYAMTLAGALGISTAPILFTLSSTHPTAGAVWRFIYALPVLAALCLARPGGRAALRARAWLGAAALSGLFFAADIALWHRAILVIGAGPATLLVNTQVLWVALFGAAFLGERPAATFWGALPVAFLGMFMLSGGTTQGIAGEADRIGLVLATVAGLSYAGMLITLRGAQRGPGGRGAPEAILTVQLAVALVALTLLGVGEGSLTAELSWQQHAWLALLGLGAQTLGWLAITSGIGRLPGHHGALLLLAQPVSALLLGWLILDQPLSAARVAGAALVLAGIAAAVLSER